MLSPVVIVVTEKRIDVDSSPRFGERLLEAIGDGSQPVIVDFQAVEAISSAGLRALVAASKKSKAVSGTIVVAGLQPLVHEVFTISRFDLLFRIFDSSGDAEAALMAQAP